MPRLSRHLVAALTAAGLAAAAVCVAVAQSAPQRDGLAWASPESGASRLPDLGPGPFRAAGSARMASWDRLAGDSVVFDWFPEGHPPPPAAVMTAVAPDAPPPCAECHGVTGAGALEIPDLAGLDAGYIRRQVLAFRTGARRSTRVDRGATAEMASVARYVSDADLAAAARYYAALSRSSRLDVVETDRAPRTYAHRYGVLVAEPGGGDAPLDGRIVELEHDITAYRIEDPNARIDVYAPRGALAEGRRLVHSGGAGGVACTLCHGADLKGQGAAPPLSGRSPGYLARQLQDFRSAHRVDEGAGAMRPAADRLSDRDITAIAAYLAALPR